MTNTKTNNLEVIFQDLSEEHTASISGGGASAKAEAYAYVNTYGGGGTAITDTYTYAQDIGGTSRSISRGVSIAIANKSN